jgi:micrococcal nuclease
MLCPTPFCLSSDAYTRPESDVEDPSYVLESLPLQKRLPLRRLSPFGLAKNVAAALTLAIVSGCVSRLHCSELLSPKYGGEGELTPAELAIFHGCHDGDTCTFTLPAIPAPFGNKIPIRLAGIDTPEMHGKCEREKVLARKAQAVTQQLLKEAKQIELLDMKRDKYFRVLAGIRADGQDVARVLIEKGLAIPYFGGTKTANWC